MIADVAITSLILGFILRKSLKSGVVLDETKSLIWRTTIITLESQLPATREFGHHLGFVCDRWKSSCWSMVLASVFTVPALVGLWVSAVTYRFDIPYQLLNGK